MCSAKQGLRGVWKPARGAAEYCGCVLQLRVKGGGKKKVAERCRQHSISRRPSSRAADEGATVCLSCQRWGELGICQHQPRLSHSHTQIQTATHTRTLTPISPPTSRLGHPGMRGEQVATYGAFHCRLWPGVSSATPRWFAYPSTAQLHRAAARHRLPLEPGQSEAGPACKRGCADVLPTVANRHWFWFQRPPSPDECVYHG